MEKDTIITLDDNSVYALIENTIVDEKEYFFAVKLDNKNNPTDEYEIFEVETENNETYMNTLEDEILKERILLEFTNYYMNSIVEE